MQESETVDLGHGRWGKIVVDDFGREHEVIVTGRSAYHDPSRALNFHRYSVAVDGVEPDERIHSILEDAWRTAIHHIHDHQTAVG